jgi:hypothetical protein
MTIRTFSGPHDWRDPSYVAFRLLHIGFVVAPLMFGIDKFTEWMTEWEVYLWPEVADVLPGSAEDIMMAVGVVEIGAAILVALWPRIGGFVVAAWLWGIIGNLVLIGGFWDIALRDFGLSIGAIALGLLAIRHSRAVANRHELPDRELTGRDR